MSTLFVFFSRFLGDDKRKYGISRENASRALDSVVMPAALMRFNIKGFDSCYVGGVVQEQTPFYSPFLGQRRARDKMWSYTFVEGSLPFLDFFSSSAPTQFS